MARIPLAWLQLSFEKLRLLAALAGITFAVMLMLIQLGFMSALFESAVRVYTYLRGDIFLVSPNFEYILQSKYFPRQRLYQSLAVDGVQSVSPIYLSLATWKHPVDVNETSLLVTGFDPVSNSFASPEVEKHLALLQLPDVVLFDSFSHVKFGPVAELLKKNPMMYTEMNHRRVRVGGVFPMGIGFAAPGNVVTSEANFLRMFPNHPQSMVDLGLVRVKPGADKLRVQAQLKALLPDDVRVLTRDEFMNLEKGFWDNISPIGTIFAIGVFMGFLVGSIIVYQILYTDVSDHLSEYATLKAIGYRDSFLFSIVIKEALLLSVLGYIPGLGLSQALYVLTSRATGLPITMTAERALLVFGFTIVMCCGAGALAMRRIRSADPAEIF
jgi:putative ABC transport system permease protein